MQYNKVTLHDIDVTNKTVIVRVDFNVPIKDGVIQDDKRIRASLPTIEYLLSKNAKIILLSHLGKVKTVEDLQGKRSLKPVALDLQKKLDKKAEIIFSATNYGADVKAKADNLKAKQILVLENTRYNDFDAIKNEAIKLESKNKGDLGKFWASLGEVFVNDAFGTAHRAHASNVGIAQNIKVNCIGFLIEEELNKLSKLNNPAHPYVAIVGGAKVSDKIGVIKNLLKEADLVLVGGGMTYTFHKALGYNIGKSLVEEDQIQVAKDILSIAKDKLILPVDCEAISEFKDGKPTYIDGCNIPDDLMALDIGIKTIDIFKKHIAGAKTIAWNGPMGVAEFKHFEKGTLEICKAIAQETSKHGCYSVIGGGDSAAAAIKLGFEKKFSHISTGGGASLAYLEGAALPGIDAINDKK